MCGLLQLLHHGQGDEKRTTVKKIKLQVDKWIILFAAPTWIRCDGGEFRWSIGLFCKERGIQREQGSSYYSPSQGIIENGLGVLKQLVKKKDGNKTVLEISRGRAEPGSQV